MPDDFELTTIVVLAYVLAKYLSYMQWLSDDANFNPVFKDFDG